jgi:hypothetical protein
VLLSQEADVLVSIRDNLIHKVAYFTIGIGPALNDFDSRLDVLVGVDELVTGIEVEDFLGG